MIEAVGFRDAEALAVAYLRERLGSAEIYTATRIPTPRRARMVKVTRTGGIRRDEVTDVPQLTIECWDLDDADAYDLARLTRAYLWALPGSEPHGHLVRWVDEIGGPTYLEDPDTSLPRYQFTVAVEIRGEVI